MAKRKNKEWRENFILGQTATKPQFISPPPHKNLGSSCWNQKHWQTMVLGLDSLLLSVGITGIHLGVAGELVVGIPSADVFSVSCLAPVSWNES